MRPNGLRRWLLRGALFSAVAIAPLAGGQAVQADDFNWQKAPDAATAEACEDAGSPDESEHEVRTESDFNWQ